MTLEYILMVFVSIKLQLGKARKALNQLILLLEMSVLNIADPLQLPADSKRKIKTRFSIALSNATLKSKLLPLLLSDTLIFILFGLLKTQSNMNLLITYLGLIVLKG